ncbi:hypothetical protein AB0442_31055 [Kitasatospora sp. NPDC085895]|uniref:hypothetical protein n=1 Tax=Kitasatospora sp. NPDC085895 TaxID=3155057 RepID=UPI00344F043B
MVITPDGTAGGTPPREGIEQIQLIGAWKVTMWRPLDSATGGPHEVRIEPHENGDPQEVARGISSTVLRQIDTASFAEETKPLADLASASAQDVESFRRELAALPKGLSDEYLAVLSALYVRNVDAGRRAPIHDLEIWTGSKQATLKGHLRAARQRGFLTKVEGKAGGRLTEKAMETLRGIQRGEGPEEVRLP